MGKKSHSEIILHSHERSTKFGIDKNLLVSKKILQEKELNKLLKQSGELLELTSSIIDDLYTFLKDTGFIVILTDQNGCIIKIVGDGQTLSEAGKLNMIAGAYMDEKSIGTNAMGTAISENCPVQITAKEHFISAYHRWTCSAAPIHDVLDNIIGTLNLTGKSDLVHPHTLGMVSAAVNAIEYRIQNSNIQKQLNNSNQFAFAMMNSLSYGLFAIDLNDEILWVNDTACRSLNIRRLHLINKPIDELFTEWKQVKQTILLEKSYIDEEGHFNLPELKGKFIFNAFIIKTKEKEILGFMLAFRELSRMMKMINKYAGFSTRYTFDDLVGESPKTKVLKNYCKTIARKPSTILITGESGTGKEIVAQAIHNASERHDSAFVAINCGAISESLIESELFGYDEGAFTGAKKGGRPGKFELADGGTLFLDEIGEMPMDMQVKLLRAIQEKAVTRVGSDKPIPVNVRILAATNKNLKEEIKKGRFRLDLYYRLNVFEVAVASLRERRQDILPLANLFLKRKAAKFDKPIPELSEELKDVLLKYDWPGNVRELENMMERAVVLDGNINAQNLGLQEINQSEPFINTPQIFSDRDTTWNLEELEKKTILDALFHYKQNITKVSQALGISRNTLYLKLKKYRIQ
jgi:sigma-54 dependent transcriptional regulator, acetoin dehydrogenase operon transcriptional activator AcoR